MLIIERIISVIAPDTCLTCGQEGSLLCEACRQAELFRIPPSCYRCGSVNPEALTCPKCRRHSPLSYVWVVSRYEGVARKLIHEFKFQSRRGATEPIAEEISATLPLLPETLVVHLPTTTRHRRQRGFDQSQLIAKRLATLRDLKYADCLKRTKTIHQRGATRAKRLAQIKGVFTVKNPNLVRGKKILLIDDVMTTGASIEEAARTLRGAGAKEVAAAVFVRR